MPPRPGSAARTTRFVATGAFVFAAVNDVVTHHDAVTFTTHMVPAVPWIRPRLTRAEVVDHFRG